MDKLFLLDAYALIYRSYYAFIRSPRINSKGLNTSAVLGFVNTLHEVMTKEHPTHIGVAFDHGSTFRHEAFPAYKAQREETPEDIKLSVPIIKDILRAFRIPILQADGFEADDVIGTLALRAGEAGIETYMLTPDKDYGQLIRDNVYMYRPQHGGGYEKLGPNEVQEKYGISTPAQVIGFWFEHKPNKDTNLGKYAVNIHELEQLTKLDFFCNLPDDIENKVESLADDSMKRAWGL